MIGCLVAVDKNQGIGFNGSIPWPRLTNDLKWFKQITLGNVVIMGRKTWESIGSKNLPGRINIVLSRNNIPDCHKSFSITNDALEFCKTKFPDKDIYVIGGATIYQQYIDVIDKFYITEIDETYTCDTFFNLTYVQKNCKICKKLHHFEKTLETPSYTINEYSYAP